MSRRTLAFLIAVPLVMVLLVVLVIGLAGLAQPGRSARTAAARPTPSFAAAPVSTPTPVPTPPPGFDHVVVVVMENHSLEDVLGSSSAPYLNSLAASGALATGYSGVSHPSLPNYLAMVGGSTFGISSDCTGCFVSSPSVADTLEAAGKTWKAYQEGIPRPCFVGSSGRYAQKHDPFIYFDGIRNDPARCGRIVPFDALAADFAGGGGAPNLAFVTPDLCNDSHDCPLATGDAWLARQVPAILSSPAFSSSRSLLVVTFDEGEGGSNRVLTVFAGAGVKAGYRSGSPYDHYSLLRTIEDNWRLAPLAAGDGAATPMKEFFSG